ncbi:MAG TPA: methionine--tRNA ligase [Candidatus Paceibacterota bacterium]
MEQERKPEITYDDFSKLDIRIGRVTAAEMVEGADKLIKCTVDLGALGVRTIVSGIAEWKRPDELVGKTLPYVVNLAPRALRGVVSEGMLLAASPVRSDASNGASDETGVVLLIPEKDVEPGSKIK